MYWVYILECSDTSLYTGITNNLQRRFEQHQKGEGGHYTSSKRVVRIIYTEEHPDRSSALKREAQIKGWRREKKLNLVKKIV
jgi:putative endonuclease